MAVSSKIARPLLASMFVAGGLDALQHPETKVKSAEKVTKPLSRAVPMVPDDPELLIRINGAVQVGAGVLLGIGRFRRLAALALIGSTLPTTYAGHRFWEELDEGRQAQQRAHFLKNLGLLGGLILAAADTEGAPSLGWRARRRADRLHNVADLVHGDLVEVGDGPSPVVAGATRLGRRARRSQRRAARSLGRAARRSADRTGSRVVRGAGAAVRGARSTVGSVPLPSGIETGHLLGGAANALSVGTDRAGELVGKVGHRLPAGTR